MAILSPEGSDATPHVRLTRLSIHDFRNVERAELLFPDVGVALIGDNGHGKTNILEAIFLAHALRSVRGAKDSELVRFGASAFHVSVHALGAAGERVGIGYERETRKKKIVVDGVQVARVVDALGAIPSVALSPRDVDLIAGAPTERRRFIDVALGATSTRYVTALQRFRVALHQRNAAIRDAAGKSDATARIAMWEPALAESGATVWHDRVRWLSWAKARFGEMSLALGERASLQLGLATSLRETGLEEWSEADFREGLLSALGRDRESDLRRGMTQAGPHRDDLTIALDRRSLRAYGSAGQQRCAAVGLRLLERETVWNRTGRLPVMLLDDPFAELDAGRARRILDVLQASGAGQVIIAVPRPDDIPEEFTSLERWEVRNGSITV